MTGRFVRGLRPRGPFVTAAAVALCGAPLLTGGLWLIALGGSWYYALAGAALVAVGGLLWRGSVWGLRLYWALLLATAVWAVAEAGLAPWPLVPRLLGPMMLGGWLCLPFVRRAIALPPPPRMLEKAPPPWTWPTAGAAVLAAALVVAALSGPVAGPPAAAPPPAPATSWASIGDTLGGSRYAEADQINVGNVAGLREAWRHSLGRVRVTLETTPILAQGLLVLCTGDNVVVALHPETGQEAWRFDPHVDAAQHMNVVCRGVAQGVSADAQADPGKPCAARIYTATIDARLIALDARTGAPCAGFGKDGTVSLMEGIGPQPRGFYYSTSPPLVAGGLVIVGAFVMDNQRVDAPSGVIRAYDATTGQLAWAWDMGRPDDHGPPPPGRTYTPGTPNVWSNLSADPALGLVYLPMGNPSPDFWGGKRRPFDERFGSAIVALKLATGDVAWSFQTTHHDLWDYDVPAQPVLVDLPGEGGPRPALVAATKRGQIFVLDRRTGAPILPVEERPVPTGAAEGDHLSPTQPYSAASLGPPPLHERDMWGITPFDQLMCRIEFRSLRYDGEFTPPGERASLKYPGAFGVIDWGGVAVDEKRAILVANSSYVPWIDQLVRRAKAPEFARAVGEGRPYEWGPQEETPFVIHTRYFLSRLGVPCPQPPWGRLSAIDLRTGEHLWSRPLGTARDSGPKNIASHLPFEMGVPNMGGAIVTRGGLAFVGASVDHYFRAFDVSTGRELWRARLPAAAHSIPMTFVSAQDGRQYVVAAAGGHDSMGPVLSDVIVAYALGGPR